MKLAVVSSYPPSKVTLNEYGYYLVNHLEEKPEIQELFLLTNELEDPKLSYTIPQKHKKIKTIPCWKFNSWKNCINITRQVIKHKPDIVLFNIQFLQFGSAKIPAALGLWTPFILRLLGYKSVVLLHNIIETVDYKKAGITTNPIMKMAFNAFGFLLTKFILQAHLVCLTIKDYVEIYNKKYNADNASMVPHGAFETPPLPNFDLTNGKKKIMTFGKFGTYKTVDKMIEAVEILRKETGWDLEIVIAGTDNPNVKGYLEGIKQKYADVPDLTFTGYVAEEDVSRIFSESALVVFPYTSTTGSSGVLHQSSTYGKAAVLPDIGDLAALVKEEGYTGEFFIPDDARSMADAMKKLLNDDSYRRQIAEQNYYAAISISMEDITSWYMLHFKHLLGQI